MKQLIALYLSLLFSLMGGLIAGHILVRYDNHKWHMGPKTVGDPHHNVTLTININRV